MQHNRLRNSLIFPALLIGMLMVGGYFRVTGFAFGLPYIDHPDEPGFMLAAQSWIDTGSTRALRMEGYPPGIIALDFLALKAFRVGNAPFTETLPLVRLLSITASLGAALAVTLLAREIGGNLAGLIAASVWLFSPLLVQFARYATADQFLTAFLLWSLYLTLIGTRLNRPILLNLSLIMLLLAITFKYQAIFMLPFTLGIPLIRLRIGGDQRRILTDGLWHSIAVGVYFFWLIFLYEAGKATQVPYWVAPIDHVGLPPLEQYVDGLRLIISQTSHPLIWIAALFGAAGLLIAKDKTGPRRLGLTVITLAALFYLIGINLFGTQDFRQYIPPAGLLAVLQGVGLVGWVYLLERLWSRKAASAMVGGAAALMMIPLLIASSENAREFSLPDRRADLMRFMDTSLPPAPIIASYDLHKVMNREWGGYSGVHDFPLLEVADLNARSFGEWRELGVRYALMPFSEWETLDPIRRNQQLILLKAYPSSRDYRGSDIAVVCLCDFPIGTPVAMLSSIRYEAIRVQRMIDALEINFYWRAEAPLDGDYAVFNHLVDANRQIIAQADGSPLFDPRRTTDTWDDPAEILISQTFVLPLTGLLAGAYTIHTGFYRRDTGTRLINASDGSDSIVVLMDFRIRGDEYIMKE